MTSFSDEEIANTLAAARETALRSKEFPASTVHELKTWRSQFEAVWRGDKLHEVRKTDRSFARGDMLLLCETEEGGAPYTGRIVLGRITHVTPPGTFGLPENVCVLSFQWVEATTLTQVITAVRKKVP